MKRILKLIFVSFFFMAQYSFGQVPDDTKFAIVKMSETSVGNLTIEIYYDNGKVVDATTLVKDFKKGKWLENFSSAAYILGYMENEGFELVTTAMTGTGAMVLTQYTFRKKQ